MRISVLTPAVETGAFATIARNLAEGFVHLGAEVAVVYSQGPPPEDVTDFHPSTHLLRLGRRSRTCVPAVARHLRERRPDALLSLGWIVNPAAVVGAALAQTHTAVFLNEQSNLSYKSRVEHRDTPALRVLATLAGVLYSRAAAVTGASADIVDDLRRNIGLGSCRVPLRVMPNAVDSERVRALALRADSGLVTGPGPLFVNVARHARQKDLPLLLRAFASFRSATGAGTLALVGTGPLTAELESLAEQLGIREFVHFRGHLANPFPQMASATAFVLSSEEEGFGLVLLEAMSLGVPVISTDCPGGPRDILRDGDDGLLVPAGDETALAAAMVRVVADSALQHHLAAAGPLRAQAFTPVSVAHQWLTLFDETGLGRPEMAGGPPCEA